MGFANTMKRAGNTMKTRLSCFNVKTNCFIKKNDQFGQIEVNMFIKFLVKKIQVKKDFGQKKSFGEKKFWVKINFGQ